MFVRIFICIGIITVLYGCRKKEKVVEVEKEVIVYQEPVYKWKRVKYFDNANTEFIKTARRTSSGFIFFTGIYNDIVFDSTTNSFFTHLTSPRDLQLKPLLTETYKLELYDAGPNIVPHNNLPKYPLAYSEKQICLPCLDSLFLSVYIWNTVFQGEVCGNDNTLLVEYNFKGSISKRFLAIKLKFDLEALSFGNGYISVEKVKIFEDKFQTGSDRFIGNVGENLMFTMGNGKNYLVNANLDTVFVNNTYSFNDLFTYKKAIYSIAVTTLASGSAHAGQTCLIKTIDNGLTWQEVACGLQFDLRSLNYTEVGDKIIAHSFLDQIWEITITDEGITSKELKNDGLTNKRIKAITTSNSRVFISTESGVFERPLNEFIDYK